MTARGRKSHISLTTSWHIARKGSSLNHNYIVTPHRGQGSLHLLFFLGLQLVPVPTYSLWELFPFAVGDIFLYNLEFNGKEHVSGTVDSLMKSQYRTHFEVQMYYTCRVMDNLQNAWSQCVHIQRLYYSYV